MASSRRIQPPCTQAPAGRRAEPAARWPTLDMLDMDITISPELLVRRSGDGPFLFIRSFVRRTLPEAGGFGADEYSRLNQRKTRQ